MKIRNKQCKACPWRQDVIPDEMIPNGYCATKHANLKSTIANPNAFNFGGKLHLMACHESKVGKETPCVGWVMHQLGPGNNLSLRMLAMDGRFKNLETVGEQHERFEDTLPRAAESRGGSRKRKAVRG